MLTPEQLGKASAAQSRDISRSVDQQEIKVGIWQGDRYQEFNLKEESPDTDLFDLCNEIVNELVRAQVAKRSDEKPAPDSE